MSNSIYFPYLQSCLSLVSETLAREESILSIEQGQTLYGRQTFCFYKVSVGTFEHATGNSPVNMRSAVVEVNVDPPNRARFVDESEWHPLPG